MRTTTQYTFDGPSVSAERRGKCPTCHKPVVRRRTFEHTVSPFNRNKVTGEPKTWAEVAAEVKAEAQAWTPEPEVFEHQRCYDARHAPAAAGYEPVPEDQLAKADRHRERVRRWLDWTETTGLPLPADPHWGFDGTVSLHVGSRMVVALADALGVAEVGIRRVDAALGVDVSGDTPDGVRVTATCWIDPKRIERPKGKTMTIDDLAAWIETTGQVQYSRRNR